MLSVVPMFHVNAWGMPYSCTIAGAKQVLPGPYMIGQPIAELIEGERVTALRACRRSAISSIST